MKRVLVWTIIFVLVSSMLLIAVPQVKREQGLKNRDRPLVEQNANLTTESIPLPPPNLTLSPPESSTNFSHLDQVEEPPSIFSKEVLRVNLSLSEASLNEPAVLTFDISSPVDAPDTKVETLLPEGFALLDGTLVWKGDLYSDKPVRVTYGVKPVACGNWTIEASAKSDSPDSLALTGGGSLYVSVSEEKVVASQTPWPSLWRTKMSTSYSFEESASSSSIAASSNPGTITVVGRIEYAVPSGPVTLWFPVSNVKVELRDYDPVSDDHLAWAWTDDSGDFEFPAVENDEWETDWEPLSDGQDIYVKVSLDTDWVEIRSGRWFGTYEFTSDIIEDVDDGVVTLDMRIEERNEVWNIYYTMREEYDFMVARGYVPDKVAVRYPFGGWPGSYGYMIDIPQDWAWNDLTILHEYGHCIMYQAYDEDWPSTDHFAERHMIHNEKDGGFALTEGWAQFMPSSVRNDPFYGLAFQGQARRDLEFGGYVYADVRIPPLRFQDYEDSGDMDGNKIEGCVASVLWDIFDSDSTYTPPDVDDDDLSDGWSKIWTIISQYRPDDMLEFWDSWFNQAGFAHRRAMNEIYWTHGIDMNSRPSVVEIEAQSTNDGQFYENFHFYCSGTVQLRARVRDDDGAVEQVEFYGARYGQWELIGTATSPGPVSSGWMWMSWDTTLLEDGIIHIYARAFDGMEWQSWLDVFYVYQEFFIENEAPLVNPPSVYPSMEPPAGQRVRIDFSASDSGAGFGRLSLHFRVDGGLWLEARLTRTPLPSTQIPSISHTYYIGSFDEGTTIDFYVDAEDMMGNVGRVPSEGYYSITVAPAITWWGFDIYPYAPPILRDGKLPRTTIEAPFSFPHDIAIDSDNNIYVADTFNGRIQKFAADGTFLTAWGIPGKVVNPTSVAVDSLGNVYVADSANNRILKFTNTGEFIKMWEIQGYYPDYIPGVPWDVAVDAEGNVYVADTHYNCIQKFTSDGTYLDSWGLLGAGDGNFNSPTGVTVDLEGNVYVADSNNHRIQKFTSDGDFLLKWGSEGEGDGKFRFPSDVDVDTTGNVFVTDRGNHRIQVFYTSGEFQNKWGIEGNGDGEFRSGDERFRFGVAVDSYGNVYIADVFNHRIQKFESDGTFLWKGGSFGRGDAYVILVDAATALDDAAFRYRVGEGDWSSWMEPTGPLFNGFWYAIPQESLFLGQSIEWEAKVSAKGQEITVSGGGHFLDDDIEGPTFLDPSSTGNPIDAHYDPYNLQITVIDDSGISEVKFRYQFSGGDWTDWLEPTGNNSGSIHWYNISRTVWLQHIEQSITWRVFALDNDNDKPGDAMNSTSSFYFGGFLLDDDDQGPAISNLEAPSYVYDNSLIDIRLLVELQDTSGVSEVKFRYRFEKETWLDWQSFTGTEDAKYWYDIPRSLWIEQIGKVIEWQVYAVDSDNDRLGDQAQSKSDTQTIHIEDDDWSPPSISSLQIEDENGDSAVDAGERARILANISDSSGIQIAEIHWDVDGNLTNGFNVLALNDEGGGLYASEYIGPWASGTEFTGLIYSVDSDNDRTDDSSEIESDIFNFFVRMATSITKPNVLGVYSDNTTLHATLKDENGNPIARKKVLFEFSNGTIWQYLAKVKTDDNGVATSNVTLTMAPSAYDLRASFEADLNYLSCSNIGTLTVEKEEVRLYANFPKSGSVGEEIFIAVIMIDDDGHACSGVDVKVLINGEEVDRQPTGARGNVSLTWTPDRGGSYDLNLVAVENNHYKGTTQECVINIEAAGISILHIVIVGIGIAALALVATIILAKKRRKPTA